MEKQIEQITGISPDDRSQLMYQAGLDYLGIQARGYEAVADKTPHPDTGIGIPRCELYLYVDNIQIEFDNAIKCGAKVISPIIDRDWGDKVCYFSDPDGHIIAFAEKIKNGN